MAKAVPWADRSGAKDLQTVALQEPVRNGTVCALRSTLPSQHKPLSAVEPWVVADSLPPDPSERHRSSKVYRLANDRQRFRRRLIDCSEDFRFARSMSSLMKRSVYAKITGHF